VGTWIEPAWQKNRRIGVPSDRFQQPDGVQSVQLLRFVVVKRERQGGEQQRRQVQ
jgi:hypothetical protein